MKVGDKVKALYGAKEFCTGAVVEHNGGMLRLDVDQIYDRNMQHPRKPAYSERFKNVITSYCQPLTK